MPVSVSVPASTERLPVPLIVGLGKAAEIARLEMDEEVKRTFNLREKLRKTIMDGLSESYLNGHPTERLPGNANISFAYVEGEGLMMGTVFSCCDAIVVGAVEKNKMDRRR